MCVCGALLLPLLRCGCITAVLFTFITVAAKRRPPSPLPPPPPLPVVCSLNCAVYNHHRRNGRGDDVIIFFFFVFFFRILNERFEERDLGINIDIGALVAIAASVVALRNEEASG